MVLKPPSTPYRQPTRAHTSASDENASSQLHSSCFFCDAFRLQGLRTDFSDPFALALLSVGGFVMIPSVLYCTYLSIICFLLGDFQVLEVRDLSYPTLVLELI
jgi:hypothetical protein